jgi:hypothetical protein
MGAAWQQVSKCTMVPQASMKSVDHLDRAIPDICRHTLTGAAGASTNVVLSGASIIYPGLRGQLAPIARARTSRYGTNEVITG